MGPWAPRDDNWLLVLGGHLRIDNSLWVPWEPWEQVVLNSHWAKAPRPMAPLGEIHSREARMGIFPPIP